MTPEVSAAFDVVSVLLMATIEAIGGMEAISEFVSDKDLDMVIEHFSKYG